jgi:large subunit GTPase 1|eukprot:CAMPEP_0169115014 /NCGR_PEP_ID=MMETSP1015-20121227/29104_1 /TAXON_ID=342587 /ORGANISM="Karlodinium micrum, Strain CCMP2283" /LENGTH=615 /DNA_ID=CAMNT_0009177413 /DNA_START=96 /DNA_END=1943 /DNA_ORIENTATION=+
MTRKNLSSGFGKGLKNEQKRRFENARSMKVGPEKLSEASGAISRSVLEQSSLDELLATVELKKEEWSEAYGEAEVVDGETVLLDLNAPLAEVEQAAVARREFLSIPRRPKWHEGMSVDQLAHLEDEAFMEWRRSLKDLQEEGGLVMTPFERNLDFWRQLWRCLERSDLVVQVLDARDPDFYFCQDLGRYVEELGGSKRLTLLINKSDFLTRDQRRRWAEHFASKGVDALFFSALAELQKQEKQAISGRHVEVIEKTVEDKLPEKASSVVLAREQDPVNVPVPDSSDDELEGSDSGDDEHRRVDVKLADIDNQGVLDVAELLDALRSRLPSSEALLAASRREADGTEESPANSRLGVVGFVGYPNVGKSTVINALVGARKVGMSRTPGKTKHIQTLQLPEWGFTLCDAPGLVFPSYVATRAHLVINNTVPLDDLHEVFPAIKLMVQKIGFKEVLERYRCAAYVKDAANRSGDHVLDEAHSFLAALAVSRNHFLRIGVPDENWAARKVLRDYVSGTLLHCEAPVCAESSTSPSTDVAPHATEEACASDEDDFDDLQDFIQDDGNSTVQVKQLTKRKQRYLQKQLGKGVVPANLPTGTGGRSSNRRTQNPRAQAMITF